MSFTTTRGIDIYHEPGVFLRLVDGGYAITQIYGDVDPEGEIAASVGSLYIRRNTGEWYLKRAGAGNSGWSKLVSQNTSGGLDVDLGLLTYEALVDGSGRLSIGDNQVIIPVSTAMTGGLITPTQHVKIGRIQVSSNVNLDSVVAEILSLRALSGTAAGTNHLGDVLDAWLPGTPTVSSAIQALFSQLTILQGVVDDLVDSGSGEVDLSTITAAILTLQTTTATHTTQQTALATRVTTLENDYPGPAGQFVVSTVAGLPTNAVTGSIYVAVDASGDARIQEGAAGYIWNGHQFVLFATSDGSGFADEEMLSIEVLADSILLQSGESVVALPLATTANTGLLPRGDKFKLNSLRSFAKRIGNGVDTVFDVTHNLNTRQLIVTVSDDGADGTGPRDIVYPLVQRFSNTVRITFAMPPDTNRYLVEIQSISKTSSSFVDA